MTWFLFSATATVNDIFADKQCDNYSTVLYMKKGRLIEQQKDEIVTDFLCKNWLIFCHFYLVKTGSKIIADLQSDNKLNLFCRSTVTLLQIYSASIYEIIADLQCVINYCNN